MERPKCNLHLYILFLLVGTAIAFQGGPISFLPMFFHNLDPFKKNRIVLANTALRNAYRAYFFTIDHAEQKEIEFLNRSISLVLRLVTKR